MLRVCTCKATLCYWAMSNNSPDFERLLKTMIPFVTTHFVGAIEIQALVTSLVQTNKKISFLNYYNIRQEAQLLQCQEVIIWHAMHTKQFGTQTRTANSVSANDERPSNWTSFKRWAMKLNVGNVVPKCDKDNWHEWVQHQVFHKASIVVIFVNPTSLLQYTPHIVKKKMCSFRSIGASVTAQMKIL